MGRNIVKELNDELFRQDFSSVPTQRALLERYRNAAQGYACIENALAVLSDMQAKVSYIYYGGFARVLGLGMGKESEEIRSIWEEPVLKLVHPDDLRGKYLQELRFYHFVKHLPKSKRQSYYCLAKLRMKDVYGNYHWAQHRIFYISAPDNRALWLTLCLYTPLYSEVMPGGMVVDSLTGQTQALGTCTDHVILSVRELQVLDLISKGMTGKQIALALSISVHTVNRHRQEILKKLQVRNSIEACRVAGELGILR